MAIQPMVTPALWIDATRPLTEATPVYPGDPPVLIDVLATLEADGDFALTGFHGSVHAGTHLDAPAHFVKGGATVDQIDPARLIGPAMVIEWDSGGEIPARALPGGDVAATAVLFKTYRDGEGGEDRYDAHHAWLGEDCAWELVRRGAALIGTDAPDIDRHSDEAYPSHKILLGAGIPILEGLALDGVAPGRYRMAALPMKIAGAEAAPARVFLQREDAHE